VDRVHVRFNPSATYQAGSISPTLSIVDVLGGSDEKDFPNSLGWYSRSKNLVIHEPFKPLQRTVDYSSWLT